ncbi:MAG TPA: dTMP kinase [Candidatus Mcinerneyibacteriales bacterium]|nr:dTMP kinase [Candidatus Mcinerneyibacteriales bacterium]HPE20235.1 dTMP kinase [Candidatus Mcinerneyibacteriales bacterium]HPJ69500.1 dTMP kinase [Candidatus Mcinerneyibacteriales bacterium]
MKGLFFTFEGGEGVGKTTQLKRVAARLEKEGYHVVTTREPGGTPLAEEIREMLLRPSGENGLHAKTELLLYLAARAQHYYEKILPALEKGSIVLCDRFMDATAAYQGFARGLGLEKVEDMNSWILEGREPDGTVLLYTDIRSGLQRERAVNRLSLEPEDFHARVLEGYLELARRHPGRILALDVTGRTIDEVNRLIMERLRKWM